MELSYLDEQEHLSLLDTIKGESHAQTIKRYGELHECNSPYLLI